MIKLDIKDLYVNLPKQGLIQSAATWLDRNINKVHKEEKNTNTTDTTGNNRTELFSIQQ